MTYGSGISGGKSNFSNRFLDRETIRRHVPSVFAEEAHESRSERFVHIPTYKILDGMEQAGFLPVFATQSRTRDVTKIEHTKHLIRFRPREFVVNDRSQLIPEIVLKNAADGSSAYTLDAGLFRIVCLNGLIVLSKGIDSLKVHHKGDIVSKVVEGSRAVLRSAQLSLTAPETWGQVRLRPEEQEIFATAAHEVRFGEEADTPITPLQLLRPRRQADLSDDLWTTFNRIQENVIKGGLSADRVTRSETGKVTRRRVSMRTVKGVDQSVSLNKALWAMAERMAELKAT